MSRRKIFHALMPLEEAIKIIEQKVDLRPHGVETVDILESLGRVLATDVYALIDYPPFDRSEVDGYAVRAEDTYGASEVRPVKLKVIGSVGVAEEPKYDVGSGEAVEIATGAPIPRGSNAVVMEEFTHREDAHVLILKSVAPQENISIAGTDIAQGELVLPRGTRLGPFEVGLLAALGYKSIDVYLRPRALVISTGNEIVEPGRKLDYGKIYDYNGYAVTAYLRSLNLVVDYAGVLPDDEGVLEHTIRSSIDRYDIVVTSGGTSAGVGDIVYRVIDKLGEVLVHGLEVKPGKPTVVGVVNNKLVVGLPGFPFSAASRAVTLLRYIVDRLSGVETPSTWYGIRARIAQRIRKDVGKDLYVPVVLVNKGTGFVAIPIQHRSGNISTMLRANAFAVIRRGIEIVDEGAEVDVVLLRYEIPEAVIIGSHDIILQTIVSKAGILSRCRFIPVGSLAGLINISKGYGDIAPIHLLDPDSKTYNVKYVKQYSNVVLVAGYKRKLVLAFRHGNPKNIKGLEDVLRTDVRFVNRNKGSGTRVFIDIALNKIAENIGMSFEEFTSKIRGYTYEVSSHTGVAAAIAQGRADLGVCIEYAARLYGLDYIPLTWEEYDFAINKESLESKKTVEAFISYLRTRKFKDMLSMYPGYEAKINSGDIIQ